MDEQRFRAQLEARAKQKNLKGDNKRSGKLLLTRFRLPGDIG